MLDLPKQGLKSGSGQSFALYVFSIDVLELEPREYIHTYIQYTYIVVQLIVKLNQEKSILHWVSSFGSDVKLRIE